MVQRNAGGICERKTLFWPAHNFASVLRIQDNQKQKKSRLCLCIGRSLVYLAIESGINQGTLPFYDFDLEFVDREKLGLSITSTTMGL